MFNILFNSRTLNQIFSKNTQEFKGTIDCKNESIIKNECKQLYINICPIILHAAVVNKHYEYLKYSMYFNWIEN